MRKLSTLLAPVALLLLAASCGGGTAPMKTQALFTLGRLFREWAFRSTDRAWVGIANPQRP